MLITDHMRDATLVAEQNGVSANLSRRKVVGTYKEISALNNAGVFTPGELKLNPVIIGSYSASCSNGSCTGKWKTNTGHLTGQIAAQGAYFASPRLTCKGLAATWSKNASGLALQRAYANMYAPPLDLGIIVGELKETLEGLRHLLSSLRTYMKFLSKKKGDGSRMLNMLSGEWLEWRYGILPIILTIQDAIKHAQSLMDAACGKMLRQRGKVKSGPEYHSRDYPAIKGFYGLWNYSYRWQADVETTHRAVVYYQMKPESFMAKYGLAIHDLPRIAWELTTLSFVWDWFFGIGDWIESLTNDPSRVVLGSCSSLRTVVSFRLQTSAYFETSDPLPTHSEFTASYDYYERRINQSLPLLPKWDPASLSIQRQIDALALTWQSLPKTKRRQ